MFNKYVLMFFFILGKQSAFLQHVNFLTRTVSHMGNTSMDTCGDPLVLDTRAIVDSTVCGHHPEAQKTWTGNV